MPIPLRPRLAPNIWFFSNPTVETYHYPLSFIYGVIGVAIIIVSVSKWFLPELTDTLITLPDGVKSLFVRGEG